MIAWFALLVLPGIYFFSELSAILSLELIASGLAIGYGIFWLRQPFSSGQEFRSIVFLLLAWLFLAGRSVFISVDPATSWPVFIKLVALVLYALLAAGIPASSDDRTAALRAAAWTGIVHGVIAVQEYIEAPPIPATWLDPATRHIFRTRCAGLMTDPNIFAAFLSVIFLLSMGLMFKARSRSEQVLSASSLLMAGIAIFTTLSRGGWIGLAAGIGTVGIFCLKTRMPLDGHGKKLLTLVSLVLLIIFVTGPFKTRLLSITSPSDMTFAQRTLINRGIYSSIEQFPIAGHGLHTFNQIYPRYRIVGGDYPMNAHNEFIHSMLETGFLSALLLAALCFFILKNAWSGARRGEPVAGFFAGAFVSLFVQNLSGFSSRILPTTVLIALTVGGIMSCSIRKASPVSSRQWPHRAGAMLLICAGVMILWQSLTCWSFQSRVQLAAEFSGRGEPGKAIAELNRLLIEDPGNALVCSMLGSSHLQAGNPQEAQTAWQKAADLNPSEAVFHINLARLYSGSDKKRAEDSYRAALKLDPASEQYRLEFARFLIGMKREAEATEQLDVALKFSPGFHQVYTGYLEIEKLKNELKATGN